MKKLILASLALAMPFASAHASAFEEFARAVGADIYRAKREDSNTYIVRDFGSEYLVRTKYCYVYAYSEPAILYDNVIYFLDKNDSCDIDEIYQK